MFKLSDVISSKTRFAILKFFIDNPTLERGVRETAREIDANVMLTRNELIHLRKCNFLKMRKVANSLQYSLNQKCKAIGALRQLLRLEND